MTDARLVSEQQGIVGRAALAPAHLPSENVVSDELDDRELPPFPAEQYAYGSLWEAILAHL